MAAAKAAIQSAIIFIGCKIRKEKMEIKGNNVTVSREFYLHFQPFIHFRM